MTLLRSASAKVGLLLLLVLTACAKEASELARPPCTAPYVAPMPADAYDFPVRPGTEAWKQFTTGQAMVDACQLPSNVLSTISTPGLLATCLDYPLLSNMLAFNTMQRGARVQIANFNGFGELSQRPDAASLLLERYQRMTSACPPEQAQWGKYALDFSYFEMMLGQDEYITQLSATQRHTLLQVALTHYAAKQLWVKDVYGTFGLKTTVFVMARILQAERYAPFLAAVTNDPDLQFFVAEAELRGQPQTLDLVIKHAKKFN